MIPGEWIYQARCAEVDPTLFHPDDGQATAPAKSICATCEVTAQCLQYALEGNLRAGVFGGLSSRQRRPLHAAYNAREAS